MNWAEIWQQKEPPLHWRLLASLYALGWKSYELVYRLGLKKRNRVEVPVIGVGSLLVGGTGKTPATIAIVSLLKSLGMRPVVLCSGYGGSRWQSVTPLEPGSLPDPREMGEEPIEILYALKDVPVVVGRKRLTAARLAVERFQPDVIVLDDGFQHLPLARDVDLVLLPHDMPIGNGFCLPAGPLREPVSGLRRASAIVLIGVRESECVTESSEWKVRDALLYHAVRRYGLPYRLRDRQEMSLDDLRGQPLVALSGIARPETFEAALQSLNLHIETCMRFPDHHQYTQEDINALVGKRVVTTEKDAVKLRHLLAVRDVEVYVLPARIEFEQAFEEWLTYNLL